MKRLAEYGLLRWVEANKRPLMKLAGLFIRLEMSVEDLVFNLEALGDPVDLIDKDLHRAFTTLQDMREAARTMRACAPRLRPEVIKKRLERMFRGHDHRVRIRSLYKLLTADKGDVKS